MLIQAIVLDASMLVSEALARLARYGLWTDPQHPAASDRIAPLAARLKIPFEEAERRMAHRADQYGAAIRRQWNASILWYTRPIDFVLPRCMAAASGDTLLNALGLHEPDSSPPIDLTAGVIPDREGVVTDHGLPVGINIPDYREAVPRIEDRSVPRSRGDSEVIDGEWRDVRDTDGAARGSRAVGDSEGMTESAGGWRNVRDTETMADGDAGDWQDLLETGSTRSAPERGVGAPRGRPAPATSDSGSAAAAAPVTEVRVWPRLEAPSYVVAKQPFEVVVGLAKLKQAGVTGGQVTMTAPAGAVAIDVTVELIADGLDAPEGWSKPLRVLVDDPTAAELRFRLVGRAPAGPEPVHLTTIEVRYVMQGTVCGTASRPLIVGSSSSLTAMGYGAPWLDQAATASAVDFKRDDLAADLTIELVKPDRNAAAGRYVCRLYSPHAITADRGPHEVDLGQDAKTFAKEIVDIIHQFGGNPLVDNMIQSFGALVTEKLPRAALDALREIAQQIAPAIPAILIVSADPYVPWELAWVDPPLDPSRPPYLGAQAIVGRWLREGGATPAGGGAPSAHASPERPPVQPPNRIDVRNMAVMGGFYQPPSGMKKLPQAEAEAKTLTQHYSAVSLAASSQAIKQLLDARLEHNFQAIGGVEAIHFAGHGDFDPSRPDSSALFLSDGMPLKSILFRSAKYGGERQPLIFLNACMIGIGGELLGDMGGFPGNCLRGGFGGVLGALWEVDDVVAHDVALAFWQRALPADGKPAEAVGAILRDLRAQYLDTAPVTTYLAYVYYGHPRLTLKRIA